jgi:hypothetical protein
MVVEIELSKTGKYAGKYVAIVDDCDAELGAVSWGVRIQSQRQQYAARSTSVDGVITDYHMHRVIMERMLGHAIPDGMVVDHILGDGLLNTRDNLRLATHAQNITNSGLRKSRNGRTSLYKGVQRVGKRYFSKIKHDGQSHKLGYFATDIEAHRAYCEAAVKYHGEFANFGENSPFTPAMFAPVDRTPIQLPLFALETGEAA